MKMNKMVKYLNISDDYQVPDTMQAIVLFGIKEENLKLATVEVPKCGDNEILAGVDCLDAPIMRVAGADALIPMSPALETEVIPSKEKIKIIEEAVKKII